MCTVSVLSTPALTKLINSLECPTHIAILISKMLKTLNHSFPIRIPIQKKKPPIKQKVNALNLCYASVDIW